MPILSEKDNPPSKPFEGSFLENEGTWWVAKTKPRQEKAFAFYLLERGIEYYLPFSTKETRRNGSGKIRKSLLPLFPSYLPFCNEDPWELLHSNRVSTILKVKSQHKFKSELQQIYNANERGFPLKSLSDLNHEIGRMAQVINGPMVGTKGKIIKCMGKYTLLLSVDGLGQAAITIDLSNISFISELDQS